MRVAQATRSIAAGRETRNHWKWWGPNQMKSEILMVINIALGTSKREKHAGGDLFQVGATKDIEIRIHRVLIVSNV